ncbi:Voltage-dependent calcium channel gamma-7 subunit [Holothuria leucospilota]|uniref:Voltage-dependent calcium channel gamma-7 subunit n=1 Tax=Holothuria leucospilota TaxID=206669 RepID=A0A9Q1C3R7_HOLLE|nr:Voltage-dependent calcium channel gamma-7 subunit [Holothuria leucospilota]
MCKLYSAGNFRMLCGISVIFGLLAWVFITIAVSTNKWLIAEDTRVENYTNDQGENVNATIYYRTVMGIWDFCHGTYLVDENGDRTLLRHPCIKVEFFLRNVTQDEAYLSYFKSLMAFELISVLAVFIGTLIASVAMVQQHPLAVLVAGFTMFFSGLFMLVGHVMMLSTHTSEKSEDEVNDVTTSEHYGLYLGWSFVFAWFAFTFCLISGAILLDLYRVCRKYMDEYGNQNPSRVKKMQRSKAVHVGATI